ncbi:hypothetical protein [Thiolapillus brandeum]|uniref:hypothetical protein n=1 Tax=Thiolapillus brandeum TaxID=1076588 RepID=UPI0012B52994|nr:hypothetical protein [Thiolapillus brandeum]
MGIPKNVWDLLLRYMFEHGIQLAVSASGPLGGIKCRCRVWSDWHKTGEALAIGMVNNC